MNGVLLRHRTDHICTVRSADPALLSNASVMPCLKPVDSAAVHTHAWRTWHCVQVR